MKYTQRQIQEVIKLRMGNTSWVAVSNETGIAIGKARDLFYKNATISQKERNKLNGTRYHRSCERCSEPLVGHEACSECGVLLHKTLKKNRCRCGIQHGERGKKDLCLECS